MNTFWNTTGITRHVSLTYVAPQRHQKCCTGNATFSSPKQQHTTEAEGGRRGANGHHIYANRPCFTTNSQPNNHYFSRGLTLKKGHQANFVNNKLIFNLLFTKFRSDILEVIDFCFQSQLHILSSPLDVLIITTLNQSGVSIFTISQSA